MAREFALPGTRPRWAPDRVVDVSHIKIELDLDIAQRRIEGHCHVTVSPILEGVRFLELDAVELDISEVTQNKKPLSFVHDGRRLRVDLGQRRKVGVPITVAIAYAATPRRGLYFIGPDKAYPNRPTQVWSQGQDEDSRFWFPCFDSPHEKATSEVRATVPKSFFALSNGDLVERKVRGDRATFHWKFDVPHSCYLITLAAGEFAEITDKWRDVDVAYYVPRGREQDAKRALGKTPKMLKLFSEKFGVPYPYKKYAQVCVADFIFGGMENTTATTLTDMCLFDQRAGLDFDMERLVAHELAHQWMGDLLTCRDWGQGWLNEGWATYCEYLWREHEHGEDEAALDLLTWAESYFGEDSTRYRRPIATNLFDEPIDIFDHHLYEKGGLVIHMLRRVLGEEPFFAALRHYIEKHAGGLVETRDFARAVEDATGRNLDWFFDQWVQKAGHPELDVAYTWDAEKNLARLTVKQTQNVQGDTPLFRIPCEVRFRVGRKDVTLPIELRDAFEAFHFPLDEEPSQAIFDPGQHVLKRAKINKPSTLWLAELASATSATDRGQAARALAREANHNVVRALEKALLKDSFWGVRAAAAESLGALRMEAARDVLVKAVKTVDHPKARRAVVHALGEYRDDEVAAEALAVVVQKGDRSYFVEAEACHSLGKTRSPRAPSALRAVLDRDSYMDVVRQSAYLGLAAAGDESALDTLIEGSRYGKASHGRRAAVLALAELCRGRRDHHGRKARERAEVLLIDPDFRVKQAAIEALGRLADPAAVDALNKVAERELDGRLRRRAREIVRDLTEQGAQSEQVKTLRDNVDELKKELYALRDRLGTIETEKEADKQSGRRGRGKRGPARTKKGARRR